MKLIATNGQETKIGFDHISVEDVEEMKRQMKAHENDPPIKFCDYVGLMKLPVGPIPKSQIERCEKIVSEYGKKIEGISYDDCCTG